MTEKQARFRQTNFPKVGQKRTWQTWDQYSGILHLTQQNTLSAHMEAESRSTVASTLTNPMVNSQSTLVWQTCHIWSNWVSLFLGKLPSSGFHSTFLVPLLFTGYNFSGSAGKSSLSPQPQWRWCFEVKTLDLFLYLYIHTIMSISSFIGLNSIYMLINSTNFWLQPGPFPWTSESYIQPLTWHAT